MIDRAEGLSRTRANSDVLIALATYTQHWNPDEGLIVAERMRRDGLALRRAVVGIGLGMACGCGKRRVSSCVHEAASTYYLNATALACALRDEPRGALPTLGCCSLARTIRDGQQCGVLERKAEQDMQLARSIGAVTGGPHMSTVMPTTRPGVSPDSAVSSSRPRWFGARAKSPKTIRAS